MEYNYTSSEERRMRRSFQKAYKRLMRLSIIAIIVAIVLTYVITVNTTSKHVLVQTDSVIVVAQEYDSLWGLTHEYCPESMDMRDYITCVIKANNMTGSGIYVGQPIWIPIFEEVEVNY